MKISTTHAVVLTTESAISVDVIEARGYRTITDEQARFWTLNGAEMALPSDWMYPTGAPLLVPMLDREGKPWGYQLRVDGLATNMLTGRQAKYVSPVGQVNRLDWGPGVWDRLQANPTMEVVVTEGVKKVDAGVSAGLAVVGLPGVDSWRGRPAGPDGMHVDYAAEPRPLPDLEDLKDRTVVIGYDSDWVSNPDVHRAAAALGRHLAKIGAEVRFLVLPDGPGGRKQGLDDFLAAGNSASDVRALYRKSLPKAPKVSIPIPLPGGIVGDAEDLPRAALLVGQQLVNALQPDVLYVNGMGWFAYDGKRWNRELGESRSAMLTYQWLEAWTVDMSQRRARLKAWQEDARQGVVHTPEESKDHAAFELESGPIIALGMASQKVTSSRGSMLGARDIARDIGLTVRIEDMDPDPWMLNLANGTLDLRIMAMTPHNPADRITKVAMASWDPVVTLTAGTYDWDLFLRRVLPDAEVRGFLQQVVGESLLGTVRDHLLPLLFGDEVGANGKSTFLKAVSFALGDYAASLNPEVLMDRGPTSAHPTERMTLFGARFVSATETDKGRRWNESLVKTLTGGDPVSARYMRQDEVSFPASHMIFLATNYLPRVSDPKGALWRRLVVVSFTESIPREEQDADLDGTLQMAADAVMAWAIEGWEARQAAGRMVIPPVVEMRTEEYRAESDITGRFLAECTRPATYATYSNPCTVTGLHHVYRAWCKDEKVQALGRGLFSKAVQATGIEVVKGGPRGDVMTFAGIELTEVAPDPDDPLG